MSFITINIHCNFIPGVKDNSKEFDILYIFNLIESPGYMITLHRQTFYIKI